MNLNDKKNFKSFHHQHCAIQTRLTIAYQMTQIDSLQIAEKNCPSKREFHLIYDRFLTY